MNNKNNKPIVSIIIATYNRDQFIRDAVLSILSQTFLEFEIIIVDDGSSDNTSNIIKEIDDYRIHYYYQTNKGRSNARNYALQKASGKYITFLDSDDLYLPNKLKLQVDYLNTYPEVHMIYTSAYCIDEDGNLIAHKYKATVSGSIYKDIAFFVPLTITLPTVMVRKEVFDQIGLFDENMHRFEDTDMWRRISKYYQIGAISTFTCKVRTHTNNSLLNQQPLQIASALKYYSLKILSEDIKFGMPLIEHGLSNLYRHYGKALKAVPHFAAIGSELLQIAQMFHYKEQIKERGPIYYLCKNIYYKTRLYILDYWTDWAFRFIFMLIPYLILKKLRTSKK